MKVSKILVHRFYFVYFYHPYNRGFGCVQTRMVSNVAGIIVKPIDFAMLPACASVVNHVLSTLVHQVALKLYCIFSVYFTQTGKLLTPGN